MPLDPTLEPAVTAAMAILAEGTTLDKPRLRKAVGSIANNTATVVIREARSRFAAPEATLSEATARPVSPLDDPNIREFVTTAQRVLGRVRAEEQQRGDVLVAHERAAVESAQDDVALLRREVADLKATVAALQKELRIARATARAAKKDADEARALAAVTHRLEHLVAVAGAPTRSESTAA